MTTALATMESEMVLLAMLPQDDRVLLVQTPRLRSIGDLEEFIVDEYARVFPHLPALSRDLRIQKCVAPNLVVDRRSHITARKQAPHFFVDLAKNVQAGNVFENMEQIYIVVNSETQTHGAATKKPSHRNETKKVAAEPRGPMKKLSAESHNAKKPTAAETKGKAKKPVVEAYVVTEKAAVETQDASKEADAETLVASEEIAAETHSPAAKKAPPVQKKSGNALLNKMLAMKHNGAESAAVLVVNSLPAAEKENTTVQGKSAHTRKVRDEDPAVDGIASAQQPPVKKMKKANVAVSEPPSTDSKAEPKTKKAPKKKAAAKSVAQADKVSDEHDKAPKVKKVAKKKAAAESGDTNETPSATEAAKVTTTVTAKKSTKKAAEKPSEESAAAAAAASPVVKASRKMKKKVDPETDGVKKPAVKRAKTEKSPKETLKAIAAKNAPEQAKTAAKTAKKVELAVAAVKGPSSDSSSSSPPADELASAEEPEVAEPPVTKNAARRAKQHKADKASDASATLPEMSTATSATKPVPFSTILTATKERIAAENHLKSLGKEGKVKPTEQEDKPATPETNEARPKPTSKSTESTASESSESDFEDKPVPKIAPRKAPTPASPKKKQPAKMVKASPKKAAAVESSSSSDEEELDYSQSLLADLTKNDTDDEQVKPPSAPLAKKTKKSKKTPVVLPSDDTATETSQDSGDLHSSDLTQKSQESNSVLLPSLSRNRFSLDSMPVAKLKKSSKNPFASPKKAKGKATRPRGRPPKAKKD